MAEPLDRATRITAIALAACIVAQVWGVITRAWFVAPHATSVGLAGIEVCPILCKLDMWTDLHAPAEVVALGLTGFLGGLNAAGFAIHAFAKVLGRQPARIKRRTITWLSVLTAAASLAFWLRVRTGLPGLPAASLSTSYPAFLAIAGSLALVVVLRLRVPRAAEATRAAPQ